MKSFVTAATLIFTLVPLPALAVEGAWKVGDTYVVRSGAIDLKTEAGRSAYFAHVQRAATKICRGEETLRRRERCVAETIKAAMESSTPGARAALGLVLKGGAAEVQAATLDAE